MHPLPSPQDGTRKVEEDWEEASFMHACKTISDYCEKEKWGPLVWSNLSEIAKTAILYGQACEHVGKDPKEEWKIGYERMK